MRWSRGEAVIGRLIEEQRLQKVAGAQADGTALLARAGGRTGRWSDRRGRRHNAAPPQARPGSIAASAAAGEDKPS